MAEIDVRCEPTTDGWVCTVKVADPNGSTAHRVAVDRTTLERLAPVAADPAALVRTSFEFLLAREPKESILRSFDLPLIGRYYPEYEAEIRRRAAG